MQKSNANERIKGFLKKLSKAALYIAAFIIFVFLSLLISSDFWLEDQKMDTNEIISEIFETLPEE